MHPRAYRALRTAPTAFSITIPKSGSPGSPSSGRIARTPSGSTVSADTVVKRTTHKRAAATTEQVSKAATAAVTRSAVSSDRISYTPTVDVSSVTTTASPADPYEY